MLIIMNYIGNGTQTVDATTASNLSTTKHTSNPAPPTVNTNSILHPSTLANSISSVDTKHLSEKSDYTISPTNTNPVHLFTTINDFFTTTISNSLFISHEQRSFTKSNTNDIMTSYHSNPLTSMYSDIQYYDSIHDQLLYQSTSSEYLSSVKHTTSLVNSFELSHNPDGSVLYRNNESIQLFSSHYVSSSDFVLKPTSSLTSSKSSTMISSSLSSITITNILPTMQMQIEPSSIKASIAITSQMQIEPSSIKASIAMSRQIEYTLDGAYTLSTSSGYQSQSDHIKSAKTSKQSISQHSILSEVSITNYIDTSMSNKYIHTQHTTLISLTSDTPVDDGSVYTSSLSPEQASGLIDDSFYFIVIVSVSVVVLLCLLLIVLLIVIIVIVRWKSIRLQFDKIFVK